MKLDSIQEVGTWLVTSFLIGLFLQIGVLKKILQTSVPSRTWEIKVTNFRVRTGDIITIESEVQVYIFYFFFYFFVKTKTKCFNKHWKRHTSFFAHLIKILVKIENEFPCNVCKMHLKSFWIIDSTTL